MARQPSLAAREARLAYWMLAPAFLIVLAVVIFPVLANFWISFKNVTLGDLRPPSAVARARILSQPDAPGETLTVRYELRNSSSRAALTDVVLSSAVPSGLTLTTTDTPCQLQFQRMVCDFGTWEEGFRTRLDLEFTAQEAFFEGESPIASLTEPRMTFEAPNILTNLVFTLDNFRVALSGREFWPSFWTTIWYTLFGTLGSIVLGLFAAQLLDAEFPGRGLLRGLFLFPYVAPVIAVAFTWVFFLDPFSGSFNALALEAGLLSEPIAFLSQRQIDVSFFGLTFPFPLALASVIAFEAWRYFPFAFLFILARFQAIPSDMYEAADMDGASPFQKFWFITLPQLVGILSTLFLLRFIWTFNKFDDIFLLTGGAAGTETLTIQVYDQAFGRSDIGAGSATAVILFVILAIFMIVYFRYAPEGE